jgi:hypothetical protein
LAFTRALATEAGGPAAFQYQRSNVTIA